MGSTTAPEMDAAPSETVTNALARLNAAKAEYQNVVKQFGTNAIREGLNRIMEIEGVERVYWTQYTPYFNDGDPCVFSVNGICVQATKDQGWDYESEDEDGNEIGYREVFYYGDLTDEQKEANAILKAFQDMGDIFLAAFGDHCAITYNGTDFEIGDYDHD